MIKKNLIILLLVSSLFMHSCERYFGDRTWACYGETGCANPWQEMKNGNTEADVKEFLGSQNIHVFDFKTEIYSLGPFCMSCGCPTGRTIYVLIIDSDIEAIKKLGFYIKD